MLRRSQEILEVYIEENKPPEQEGSVEMESRPIKLSIPNIFHPEWVAGAIRRVRNVKRIVVVGNYTDEANIKRHVIKVLYDGTQVTDDVALLNLADAVDAAVYASGAHGHHL